MTKHSDMLFVFGPPKTCSSTIIGMLNCHPDIFILYESFTGKKNKSGGKVLIYNALNIPNKDRFNPQKNVVDEIHRFKQVLELKTNKSYKLFGDKWISCKGFDFADELVEDIKEEKVICSIRDVRGWLCHPAVRGRRRLDSKKQNITKSVSEFVYTFISSFKISDRMTCKLESFVEDNDKIISQISNFVGINLPPYTDCWWDKMGKYPDNNKMIHNWWNRRKKRKSAFTKPKKLDVLVQIKNNPMWDALLPVFDKYFNNPNSKFSLDEINNDLSYIRQLKVQDVSIKDCYDKIKVVKL